MTDTNDPAMKKDMDRCKNPCALIKYDWDLNKDEEFCLNPKECNLDFNIDKRDLCFSFCKGERILVYVRIIEEKTNSLSSLSISKIHLSNIREKIKDIYQIDTLTKEELKQHLLYFVLIKYKGKTHKQLNEFIKQTLPTANT
jgi:hypothetical protein